MKKMLCFVVLLTAITVVAQPPAGSQDPKAMASQPPAAAQSSQPQQPPADSSPAAAQRQAEQKEFQAAAAEKDPARKVRALESFLKAHPKSLMVTMAQRELISALIKVSPRRAVKWVANYGKKSAPLDRAPLSRHLAATLLRENKNLKDAEKYAGQAIVDYNWDAYLAAARKRAADANRAAPAEESLRRSYNTTCADLRAVLGQVYLKRGNQQKAQEFLLGAVRLDPSLADAAQSLAEMAEKQGKNDEALQWYANAALSRPNKERKVKFAEVYAKQKSSTVGMEEYLDAEYHRLFPPTIHAEAYQQGPKRSDRVVLVEVYTGAGCPPCAGADLAFDAVLERYSRRDVAVVMYHLHIPRPDPMTHADTVARWKFQQGRGVPTYGVDGEMSPAGGGGREAAVDIEKSMRKIIDARLETSAGATLEFEAERQGRTVKVNARAGSKDTHEAALTLVLVEKQVRYSGENSIRFHPMVARSIKSFELKDGSGAAVHSFNFDEIGAALKKHIDDFEKFDERHNKDGSFRFAERRDTVDWSNIAVVAFVQDLKSKKVLQAGWIDLSVAGGKASE